MVHDLVEDHVADDARVVRLAGRGNRGAGEGLLPIGIARLAPAFNLRLEDPGIDNPAPRGVHQRDADALTHVLDDGEIEAELRLGERDEASRGNACSLGDRETPQVAEIITEVEAAKLHGREALIVELDEAISSSGQEVALVDHHRNGRDVLGQDLPPAHQRRDKGQVGAGLAGIVDADRQDVPARVQGRGGNGDLRVRLVGRVPHRPVGFRGVGYIPAGHVDAAHLLGVHVDHETIIEAHAENNRVKLRGVVYLEDLPAEDAHVVVAHVIELGAVISITVADAGGSALPVRIIEIELAPTPRGIAPTPEKTPGGIVRDEHAVDKAHLGVEVRPPGSAPHLRAQLPAVGIIAVGIGLLDGEGVPGTLGAAGPLAAVVVAHPADTDPLGIRQLDGLAGIVQGADEIADRIGYPVPGLHRLLVAAHDHVGAVADKGSLGKDQADSTGKTVAREIVRFRTIVEDLDEFQLRTRDAFAIGRVEVDLGDDELRPAHNRPQAAKQQVARRPENTPTGRLQDCAFQFHRNLFFPVQQVKNRPPSRVRHGLEDCHQYLI